MLKTRFYLIAVLLFATLSTACRKYEEGPNFSLRSKTERVSNDWNFQSLARNNIDESEDYERFNMVFTKEGRLSWTIKKVDQPEITVAGDWELASVNEQVKITFDDPDINGETRLLFLDILLLEEEQIRFRYLSEGDFYNVFLN
ncbi:MAG: hypothetical protein AAF696_15730 [Bacteroidota bacterium]